VDSCRCREGGWKSKITMHAANEVPAIRLIPPLDTDSSPNFLNEALEAPDRGCNHYVGRGIVPHPSRVRLPIMSVCRAHFRPLVSGNAYFSCNVVMRDAPHFRHTDPCHIIGYISEGKNEAVLRSLPGL
jgi:hypothetical protein